MIDLGAIRKREAKCVCGGQCEPGSANSTRREVLALVEEVERLRKALTRLDPQCITSPPCGSCVGCDARAALGETP